ncbi:MAG: 2-oxo acid dehydrogenase subunit E2 [Eubacteriaceae bacterium]|jgi:pyruvate dehydrogenase E2 component (dihydrolipoamide acetyltransferase)|nr:2-oxo acid dehydrogenase subunit E2 [Eubacteriaceae bacterium]
MARELLMPKLGLTMKTGKIVKWYVKEGDKIASGDNIFDVENEKLTNTIQSPADGTLLKIILPEGGSAPVLDIVGVLGEEGEDISSIIAKAGKSGGETEPAAAAASPAATKTAAAEKPAAGRIIAAPAAKKLAREKGVDLSLVAGSGPKGRIVEADVEKFLAEGGAPASAQAEAPAGAGEVRATPLAEKMAQDKGIDLTKINTDGRITAAEVAAFAAGNITAPAGAAAVSRETREPMSGMRKVIAQRMRESQDISPTVTYNNSVDMTQMKAAKDALKKKGIKVSYTDLLVKMVSKALLEFPLVNCSIEGEEIIYHNYVNMGVAVALPDGLIVPVVDDADSRSLEDVSAQVKQMAADAREGKLNPDRLQGGTFTISNLGMYGIETFTPIINQPQVAILGVNAMIDTPVVIDGEITVRPIMALSLTADHRAVDGSKAAEFLQYLKSRMETPLLLLI